MGRKVDKTYTGFSVRQQEDFDWFKGKLVTVISIAKYNSDQGQKSIKNG